MNMERPHVVLRLQALHKNAAYEASGQALTVQDITK